MRPAHSQHADDERDGERRRAPGPTAVWYAARPVPTDMPASAMPAGTMSTKRRANRAPACLARASLRPCVSCTRSSIKRLEAAVEVGAADLVGDEQRLADGVGGRVGQAAP